MNALVFDGRVRHVPNHPDPKPAADECVVRVRLAGVCATDLEIVKGYMGFRGVLGHEMVGVVEHGPPKWRGQRVVAEINCVCRRCDMCQAGLATHCRNRTVLGIAGRDGCFADLVAVPERNLHEVPSSITDEEAVFVEPLAAALQVVKQCPIDSRTKVAVVGSGRLGLLVAQVLAELECRLQVVGRNPLTLAFCEKRGIQPTAVEDLVPRADHDVVVDCTGSPDGLGIALTMVRPRGTLVLKSTYHGEHSPNLAPAVINEVNIVGSRCGPFADAISALARRRIDVASMVSRVYKLDRGVEAFAAAGSPEYIKVLIRVSS